MKARQRSTPIIAQEEDSFYDYLYLEYAPRADYVGKLRSVELFYQTLDAAECGREYYSLVSGLQRSLGVNRTVWGVKKTDDKIWWELYWYNFREGSVPVTIEDVLSAMPFIASAFAGIQGRKPDSMFSIDLPPDFFVQGVLAHVHVYLPGQSKSTGLSYLFDSRGHTLKNHYTFLEPLRDFQQIKTAIKQSAYLDSSRMRLHEILVPELIRCKSICIARKRHCDGIYYSGLGAAQLQFFLEQHDYPRTLIEFVRESRPALDHLRFDVGFDYRMSGGQLQVVKSSFYGTF